MSYSYYYLGIDLDYDVIDNDTVLSKYCHYIAIYDTLILHAHG